jgi:hypothetical protein
MSAIQDALRPMSVWALTRPRVGATPYRLPVYAACALLALLCNYQLGVDVGWDTLDYHLYAGFSAVHDRFAQDYFPAGPQSYFNPYIYAPYYLLVTSGLSALSVSSILAIAHSTVLWLTYELANCVCPSDEPRVRLTSGLCAVALAFLNPVLVQQIGSSFADITTAALVLFGWWLLARALHAPRAALIAGGGLLLGAAAAFKLTNAVHAVAAVALLLMLPEPLHRKLRRGLQYASAAAFGFAVVAAPWAWYLERQFGNPFFPLLNGVFRSPQFTSGSMLLYRFVPRSLAAALWWPFETAIPVPKVQVELLAPDIRYAVLVVLAAAAGVVWLWRRRGDPGPQTAAELGASRRVLAALGLGLAVDWVLWISASGNGRYFLPMGCVAAVLIVALLFRAPRKVRNYALAAILVAQCIQLVMGTDSRSVDLPWSASSLRVSLPARLAAEPNLYLTAGVQSNSFLAPFLPPGSGVINFAGVYALGAEGAAGAHVAELIRRYGTHVRMLVTGRSTSADPQQGALLRSRVDDALERFGLTADPDDCATIEVHGVPPPIMFGLEKTSAPRPRDTTYLLTCRAVAGDPADLAARRALQRAADLVLDRVEDACPQLFQPRRMQTVHDNHRWLRQYTNTDLLAWVSHGEVWFSDLTGSDPPVGLGTASAWAQARPKVACGWADGRYFVRVLPTAAGP